MTNISHLTSVSSAQVLIKTTQAQIHRLLHVQDEIDRVSRELTDLFNEEYAKRNRSWLRRLGLRKLLRPISFDFAWNKLDAAKPKRYQWYDEDIWMYRKQAIIYRSYRRWEEVERLQKCAKDQPNATNYVSGELWSFIIKWANWSPKNEPSDSAS